MEFPSLRKLFDPVGKCIYCWPQDHDGVLTSEHIVPEGLGGRMELLGSSCLSCARITSTFEQEVLRGVFYPARAHLKLLSKKRKKEHPKDWPVEIDFGTHKEPRRIPIAEHPTLLVLFVFDMPGVLIGRPAAPPDQMAGRVAIQALNHAAIDKALDRKLTMHMNFQSMTFARVLAKIGHSYAVAKLGIGKFKPTLVDTIKGAPSISPGHYVGCGATANTKKTLGETLHEIELTQWDEYHVVKLRLFASFEGMPTYYLVAGEI